MTWALYRDLLNTGTLSFISITDTSISKVPDRTGLPPSTAVSVSLTTDCFSLSRGFTSTNSAETLCSPLFCTSKEKYSFGPIERLQTGNISSLRVDGQNRS
uniref:Uncharacterized protein n=1 Tax=Cynoglossus semilaevis TaxID=244447 RepID=A0A3P8V6U0_CYNSE